MTYFSDPPGQPVIEGYNPNGYAEAGESIFQIHQDNL
jgi:hypothetical protein